MTDETGRDAVGSAPARLRDHLFIPMKRDARYCGHMSQPTVNGNKRVGYVSFSSECDYPPAMHPSGSREAVAFLAGLAPDQLDEYGGMPDDA
jgi:hypothetical protein